MKLTAFITSFLLLVGLAGQCQRTRPVDSIETVKILLRQNGAVESFYLGLHGKPSKQCLRFLFLAKRLNVNEIEYLINDTSNCLRIYAYCYLRSMYNKRLKQIKLALQNDSSRINFMDGCAGGNIEVRYVLKWIKQWETKGRFNTWMKNYKDLETKWNNFLITD